ncbi:MAG: SurA N-terminal domain-containing protein, partial [Opitutaceae bacterium]|nr:SurA N-terminal domain-containing protein [Verrucomicrobiales bacterium]
MFGTIRKHQNWLWYIIIFFIVVSFVVYFSPYQKVNDASTQSNFGKINGKEITRGQWETARRETHLFHYLRYKSWPGSSDAARQTGFDVERETYNRLFLLEKMAEMKLQVSPEAAAKWITQVLGSSDDKPFDFRFYDRFVTEALIPHGITGADFEQFAAHEVARQHLIAVHGQSGRLVTPQEAEFLYRRENQPLDTEIVLVEATNFLSKVQVTPAALAQFYTNNQAAYYLPDRMQVQFIKYDTTNFLVQAAT